MRLSRRVTAIEESATLAVSEKARVLRARGIDVAALVAGEPDFDTPENIKAAAVEAIRAGFTKYTPTSGIPELRAAIAEKLQRDNGLQVSPEAVLVSCGAKHSIYNFFHATCEEGDEVLIPAPYWVSYPEQVKSCGAVPVVLPTREEEDWKVRPEALARALTPRTRAFVLNSPSNPTGTVYSADELRALGAVLAGHGTLVLSDEIYEKLVYDGARHHSLAALVPELAARTVTVNGFSKAYAMTGWRLGYAAGPRPILDAMAKLQSQATSNATSVAQRAALAALTQDGPDLARMCAEFDRRRRFMVERLRQIPGLTFAVPQGAFYVFPRVSAFLGRTPAGGARPLASGTDFATALLEIGHVAGVPGEPFGAPDHIRLSYATAYETIARALDRLAAFVAGLR
ncbi:MAG: pyridoxal phosphate-dependent aminotransferase [Planctomycetes bacterium]|nr:pyridoxal phosphate-dependent aminotransferase [Planctomycetota bacterium]